jgi:hypothetical protein
MTCQSQEFFISGSPATPGDRDTFWASEKIKAFLEFVKREEVEEENQESSKSCRCLQ